MEEKKKRVEAIETELESTASSIENRKAVMEKTSKSINGLKDDRDALANKRK